MSIVIHHHSDCGTSGKALNIIRESGEEPIIIDYMQTGWTRPQLQALFAAANLTPRAAMRTERSPAEELGLLSPDVDDDTILDAMIEHPVLVQRPIVCTPKGVRLCRPLDVIHTLLGPV